MIHKALCPRCGLHVDVVNLAFVEHARGDVLCARSGESAVDAMRAQLRSDLTIFAAEARKYTRYAAAARKQLAALKGKR